MRREFTNRLRTMTLLCSALLMGLLPSCAMSETNEPTPVLRKMVQIQFVMYETIEEVTAVCKPKYHPLSNGCTRIFGPGRVQIVGMMPKDWCDWERMRTLGHEAMHAMGMHHSNEYAFDRNRGTSWRATECTVK